MSGGGGKGGQSQQSIDPRLAAASSAAIDRATAASKLPYAPNRGVTIAAFTPQQEAAMRNTGAAATAFGMEGSTASGMPPPETSASGIRGYSTGKDYDEMIAKSLSPELQAAINNFFSVTAGAGGKKSSGSGDKPMSIKQGLMNTMGLNSGGMPAFGEGK